MDAASLVERLRDLAKSKPGTPVTSSTMKALFRMWARIREAEHQDSGRAADFWSKRKKDATADLFADAIPIEVFLSNAGGPFHQWSMSRKDWLTCFRCVVYLIFLTFVFGLVTVDYCRGSSRSSGEKAGFPY